MSEDRLLTDKDAECYTCMLSLINRLQGVYNQANDLRVLEGELRDFLWEERQTLKRNVRKEAK